MNYRPEIDGLRALAVLLVIGFHYLPDLFGRGFLGVDIFFVISGFVISGSMWHLDKSSPGDFLTGFWSRRIRRLMPALLVCVLFTCFLLLVLTSRPTREMFATGGMSLVGLSNIYLYFKAADYFALDAQINPFTHTWSLGVEEQFYLIFPLLALLLGMVAQKSASISTRPLMVLCALLALSLLAYMLMGGGYSTAVFYLSPYRFWELLAGVIAFLVFQKNLRFPKPVFYIAALGVVVGLFVTPLPVDLSVTLTVFSTAIAMSQLKSNGGSFIVTAFKWGPVNYIGRLSYSLYLYHWPLYVIAALTIGHTPMALLICTVLTFCLSALSYHFVETPFRKSWGGLGNFKTILTGFGMVVPLAMVLVFAIHKFAVTQNNFLASILGVTRPPSWSKVSCHGEHIVDSYERPLQKCLGEKSNGKGGDIYLVGDSHAAQLSFMVRDMVAQTERQMFFINAGRSSDFPYVFWRQNEASGDRVLKHILSVSDPGDVLVVSFHRGHLNAKGKDRDRHVSLGAQTLPSKRSENFVNNMRPLIEKLHQAGLKLILVGDTPLLSYVTTVQTCALQTRLLGSNTCAVSRVQDEHTRRRQVNSFKQLEREYPETVYYFDPLPLIYGSKKIFDPVMPGGGYRMVDWNHMTQKESILLSKPFARFMKAKGL